MTISATRKTGFLVEDGQLWGQVIGYLRYTNPTPVSLALARELDLLRAQNYYEPLQPKLIAIEQIDEVTA